MKLRYIEVFLALAHTPNMHDVAHKLFVTQAAISSTLRDLEEEIGVSLFDRVGRGIQLNEKGKLLKTRLNPLYEKLNGVLSLFKTEELAGNIKLGVSTTLINWIFPQILYNFKKTFPQVELDCHYDNTREIVRKVESAKLDIGFVEGDVTETDLHVSFMGSEELIIVTADKTLAEKAHNIEELMEYFWLIREVGSGTREDFFRILNSLNLQPKRFLELAHTDAIKHVLQNPDTLTCVSPHSVELEINHGMLFAVAIKDVRFTHNFYCVERHDSSTSQLRETLKKQLQSRLSAALHR